MATLFAAPPGRPAAEAAEPYGDLAQALQMSLYFYDAQKSGPARSLGRQPLAWRGDSEPEDARIPLVAGAARGPGHGTNLPESFVRRHRAALDPDGHGVLDLSGGYHDAGDHVKFGLPQAYSASVLAWAVLEFGDAFRATGSHGHVMEQLYWFCDYFLRTVFRDGDGDVVAFAYMVGQGQLDHAYWGPPEAQHTPRTATLAYPGHPASDAAATTAAALALMSILTGTTDPRYSQRCRDTARALYRFARAYRGTARHDDFYPNVLQEDKLAWAALWLHQATGVDGYLHDVIARDAYGEPVGHLRRFWPGLHDQWGLCWSSLWPAVFARVAVLTQGLVPARESRYYWQVLRWNLEFWSGGTVRHPDPGDDVYVRVSPGGYSVLSGWGSARYNTAAQLCALVYGEHADTDPDGDELQAHRLARWALSQMDYLLGANPLRRSYVVGFRARPGDDSVRRPHHRGAHGSSVNDPDDPPEHRNVLWGALVGGPDAHDRHTDATRAYHGNEVALDYNASFVGALAGLFTRFAAQRPVRPWRCPDDSSAGRRPA